MIKSFITLVYPYSMLLFCIVCFSFVMKLIQWNHM